MSVRIFSRMAIAKAAGILAVVIVLVALHTGEANAFGNVMFDNADIESGAQVMMVNANTRYVRESNSEVGLWFPNNSGSITIKNGHFCNSNPKDYMEGEDGSWGDFSNGDNVTSFHAHSTGINITHYGKKRGTAAQCSADITFNFSNIQDRQNGYYRVDLDIAYVGNGSASYDGVVNYFQIKAEGQPNVKIGSRGGSSGYTTTAEQVDTTPAYATYHVPFGTPCDVTSNQSAAITLYDLDNAGGGGAQPASGAPVRLKIRDLTADAWVNFAGSTGDTWTPPDTQNAAQSKGFTAKPGHKYRLDILDVFWNNTIQYSIPYAQIFRESCKDAKLQPKAQVVIGGTAYSSDQVVSAGTPVTFRNWVKTSETSGTGSDTFRYRAVDTGPGDLPTAADLGPNDYQLDPDRDVPGSLGAYNFNTTGLGGKFCRETRISNYPGYARTPDGTTKQICVTILYADCNITLSNNEPDALTSPLHYNVDISTNPGYTATLDFTFTDHGGYSVTDSQTGTNGTTKTFNVTAPPGGFALGNATGSVHITIAGAAGNCSTTDGIYNRPYLSVYGGDTIAGTSADAAQPGICTYTADSKVVSWNHDSHPANDYAGAGGSAAVFASGNISHFSSGLNITNLKPAGLSFGNDAGSGVSLASGQYGGKFNGTTPTSCDFSKGAATPLPGSSYSNSSFSGHHYYTASGNVYISGNVIYTTAGWAQLSDIPSFKLVVTGGNIYINNDVTELDGLYAAIPSGGTGGHIYTCATGIGSPIATNTASYYAGCNHQLTIRGSFAAKQIHFDRTYGTLSQAATSDTYTTTPAKAAEEFIYGPEMWLPNGSTDDSFRPLYYQGLPPVL